MNRNRRLLIIGTGIVFTLVVAVLALRVVFNCCALPPLPTELTRTAIDSQNQTLLLQLTETQTAAVLSTTTPPPTALFPYDPTLYAQRRQEEMMLQTGAGPTQYAIFFATETALVATYQSTILPTSTPAIVSPTPQLPTPPYDATLYAHRLHEQDLLKTVGGPTEYAVFFATETALVATYQGTALPSFTPSPTPTPTPTLCPYSDVICPGGNETLSPAQEVLMLMASASAPEYGQLAQTATALYVTPTATPTAAGYGSCVFSWAHQDLPEIAETVRTAFASAEMTAINVIRADAYGENCSSGGTQRFLAMTTDFYLSADVDDLTDTDKFGQIITDAYTVLMNLDLELPARHGYLDIEFKEGGETKRFRAMFSQIKSAVEAEADGAAIIEAGGGLG